MWTKLTQAIHVVILVYLTLLYLTILFIVMIIYRQTMERVLKNKFGRIRKEERVA
jgi:hypothetical protein